VCGTTLGPPAATACRVSPPIATLTLNTAGGAYYAGAPTPMGVVGEVSRSSMQGAGNGGEISPQGKVCPPPFPDPCFWAPDLASGSPVVFLLNVIGGTAEDIIPAGGVPVVYEGGQSPRAIRFASLDFRVAREDPPSDRIMRPWDHVSI